MSQTNNSFNKKAPARGALACIRVYQQINCVVHLYQLLNNMSNLLLLDLDGTVREHVNGGKFISHPKDQRLIKGVTEAIAYFHKKGWRIIGITNQGGVAAGHKSLENAAKEQKITLELVPEMECIYFCPDYEGEFCYRVSEEEIIKYERDKFPNPHSPNPECRLYQSFRKPGSGMLMLALDSIEFYPDEFWFIGDREEDYEAAKEANIDFMWADVWRSKFLKGLSEIDLTNRQIDKDTLVHFLAL